MAKNTDSNVYTVVFAVIMVVVVGAILAFVASSLNGKIKENERLETQQNILYAMGENQDEEPYTGAGSVNFIPAEKAETEFKKYIKKQYVLQGDEMKEILRPLPLISKKKKN